MLEIAIFRPLFNHMIHISLFCFQSYLCSLASKTWLVFPYQHLKQSVFLLCCDRFVAKRANIFAEVKSPLVVEQSAIFKTDTFVASPCIPFEFPFYLRLHSISNLKQIYFLNWSNNMPFKFEAFLPGPPFIMIFFESFVIFWVSHVGDWNDFTFRTMFLVEEPGVLEL